MGISDGGVLPDQMFRALADHVADLAYLADAQRCITWIAPTVEEVLGWAPAELIGRPLLDIVHPDDIPGIAHDRERLYTGGPVPGFNVGVTMRLRGKDGRYHWFSGRGVSVRDDAGRPAGIAAGMRCVDDLVEERERARSTEQQVRMVLDGMLDPHLLMRAIRDRDGRVTDFRFVHVNREAARVIGVEPQDLLGSTFLAWRPALQKLPVWTQVIELFEAGDPLVVDDLQLPHGFTSAGLFFDIRAVRLGDQLSCVFRDVTARHKTAKRIAESERRFRLLAENTSDVVVTVRPDGAIDWVSPAAQAALGVPIESVLERRFHDLIHPEDQERLSEPEGAEVRIGHDERGWRWMRLSRSVLTGDGSMTVYTAQDIQAEMAARTQLAHELGHDPLTGLANRTATLARLRELLRARTRRESLALLAVGIDDLRSLNEAFSYAAGDRVLTQIARRLLAFAETADDVSRVGDNELTLIVHDVEDVAALADLASGLLAELPSATTIDGHQIRLTVSVGIATPDSQRALDLLRDATSALHHARAKGGNRWEYLDSADTHAARERLILRSGIHKALAGNEIRPWFQPVVRLADGQQTGYEALARWVHNGEVILPGAFIPVAESTDLIVTLDRHILRTSLAAVMALDWPAQVGINVSAPTLSEPDFAESVQDELDRSGYDPAMLHLEVTETALLNPTGHVQQVMRELAELGVTWWVDDFGTGYSSITHIRDLPVQGLKLDCSFTAGLPDDGRAVRLAQGLMGLANGLRMRTTAEGVETPQQAALLAEQGWELGQGWLYGRPSATP